MDVSSEGTNTKHGWESWFQIQIQRFHFCISKEHTDQANISTCFLTVKVSQKDISTLQGMKKKKKWGKKVFYFLKRRWKSIINSCWYEMQVGGLIIKKEERKTKTPHDMTHNFNILGLCCFFVVFFGWSIFAIIISVQFSRVWGIYYFNFGSKFLFYRSRK